MPYNIACEVGRVDLNNFGNFGKIDPLYLELTSLRCADAIWVTRNLYRFLNKLDELSEVTQTPDLCEPRRRNIKLKLVKPLV